MDDIGPWFQATIDHIKRHWQAHLLPIIVFYGASMVLGMVFTFAFLFGGMLVAVVGGASGSGAVTMVAAVTIFGGIFALLVAGSLCISPLWAGYLRQVIKLHRGEPTDNGDLLWGYRNLGRVLGLALLRLAIGLVAVMACYLPVIPVGVAFFFALPVMVDRELGPIDSLKASWELAKPHFLALLVVMVALMAIAMVLAYVPFVGGFLSFLVSTSLLVVIYDDLARRDHERRAGA